MCCYRIWTGLVEQPHLKWRLPSFKFFFFNYYLFQIIFQIVYLTKGHQLCNSNIWWSEKVLKDPALAPFFLTLNLEFATQNQSCSCYSTETVGVCSESHCWVHSVDLGLRYINRIFMCVFSPTLSECHVEICTVIIRFASPFSSLWSAGSD